MVFDPSRFITLTTDFGHRGPFIGVMKGVILSSCADAKIIDLTHECLVHWPAEAGFWIARSYAFFPKGTIHLAVVDPGVGTERGLIIILAKGHAFLGPNNGLLSEVAEFSGAIVRSVSSDVIERYRIENESTTFHGRDILAPLVAALASGEICFDDFGPECDDFIAGIVEKPEWFAGVLTGQIVTTDNFGNLITNISREDLASLKAPVVSAGGEHFSMKKTYGDVVPGQNLVLINSLDMLEIACSERSATEVLGIGRGSPVKVMDGGKVS